ncbi:MAG: hypothetical protein E4H20_02125 [Spirochaetales bacterium]|nr:MAG: hypothetical protein E4H20_02125 [Spirochaetales bacterium]
MPIKPIDLQTLFAQLEQVGRQQSAEKQGAALHQSLHGAALQRKEDESARSVKAVEDDQKGTEAVKDESEGGARQRGSEGRGEKPDEEDSPKETVKDPALGGHVDISG